MAGGLADDHRGGVPDVLSDGKKIHLLVAHRSSMTVTMTQGKLLTL